MKLGLDKVIIGLNLLRGLSHYSYQLIVISDLVNFGENYVYSFVEILQFLNNFQILACYASVGLNTKQDHVYSDAITKVLLNHSPPLLL